MELLANKLNLLENEIIEFKTRQETGADCINVYESEFNFEATTELYKHGVVTFDYATLNISPLISVYFTGTVQGVDFNEQNNYGSVELGYFLSLAHKDLAMEKSYNTIPLILANKTTSNGIRTEARTYRGTIHIRTSVPIVNIKLEWKN